MRTVIQVIGENAFFTNIKNPKLRLLKILCSFLIIAVLIGGIFLTAKYLLNIHRQNAIEVFATAVEDLDEEESYGSPAVVWTGAAGDPYKMTGIQAYFESYSDGEMVLNIGNVNDLDVWLISMQDQAGEFVYYFDEDTLLEDTPGEIIYHTFVFEEVDSRLIESLGEIKINYMYDDDIAHCVSLIPYKSIDDDIYFGTDIRLTDNMDEFTFIGEQGSDVFFEGQHITIDKPLYIPAGKQLVLSAGQHIDLVDGAFIVARCPIMAAGTSESGIAVSSSDGTGRGLFVCQAEGESVLTYVTFDGLDTPKSGVWRLTGAITFYESDVGIDNCSFINNTCEDGLNIVRSNFSISDSLFKNTAFDAFDADFCTGEITGCVFEDTGNDGVDVSTTTLELSDTVLNRIGDKGISGGENSTLTICNISVESANIGLASKDMSQITGSGIDVKDVVLGLALYQKKPEFGPASIDIEGLRLLGFVSMDYLIQDGSSLTIDGEVIKPRSQEKEDLLLEKIIAGEPIQ